MRSMFVTAVAALTLSAGVLAQSDLPKQMQDVKTDIKFANASVPDTLTFLGKMANVDIRYQVSKEPARFANVGFKNASVADVFSFLVRAADLQYTVVDDRTIVVTNQ